MWFKQSLPATLHPRLTHLFLTGLHDSQLMYAIKMSFPAGELTFDNVVERYERCHTTEWGAAPTCEPGEEDTLIRAKPGEMVEGTDRNRVGASEDAPDSTLAQMVAEAMSRSVEV
jgi:hypothetical protein